MYKLRNGKLSLTVYTKKDMELYIKSGWVLEGKKDDKKKKLPKEVLDEDKFVKTEFTESN